MNRNKEAQLLWDTLLSAHPRRTQFALKHLLEAFQHAFPYRHNDADARSVLARLLTELESTEALRLPSKTNRRAYDYSERTPLPKHVSRRDRLRQAQPAAIVWRPEIAFAADLVGVSWQKELLAVQEWLRSGGTTAAPVALRERSVEIFGDEKRLDSLLGSQLFAPGRLTLALLRCYLPSVPVYVVSLVADGLLRPLLVAENHTTFDTLCRWNEKSRCYAAVAFGAGSSFIAACTSLRVHLTAPGCSGELFYFGDLDPKGLWIPARASRDSGIKIQPDVALYALLLTKGRKHQASPGEPFPFDQQILDWLPSTFGQEISSYFKKGCRLPQELISLPDLLTSVS